MDCKELKKSAEELCNCVNAFPVEPPPDRPKRKLKKLSTLLAKDLPELITFVGVGEEVPILTEGTCIISSKPKLGKSWFVLNMLLALSFGADFLGYKTKKCSVLYLDLETSEPLEQKRANKAINGTPIPENFYIDTETDRIDSGFIEQLEAYLKEDVNIGVIVVDVFQMIRSKALNYKEDEYSHAYRDITPLNEFAQKHHVAIILVCHDRKSVDPDDPFSNILGSTGLQGAVTQMMVMFKRKKDDPIHISIKGKTIDGLPELDVRINNGRWERAIDTSSADYQKIIANHDYSISPIRKAVLALVDAGSGEWKGFARDLKREAINVDVPLIEETKDIGLFIVKNQGRFLLNDGLKVRISGDSNNSKRYIITKGSASEFQSCVNDGKDNNPFI